jgi:nucleoside-diphosphate-sugar epimerase
LRWSIFRLAAIMGPQTRLDPLFFNMPLETSLEIASARDTGFALVEAIHHQDELRGRIFNLSGGIQCRTSYREFLNRVFGAMGLEKIALPDQAFARRNFHCGYYVDACDLEEILHFQEDTLEDYYRFIGDKSTSFSKKINSVFHKAIRYFLLIRSEPMHAHRKKKRLNSKHMRFFYSHAPGTAPVPD